VDSLASQQAQRLVDDPNVLQGWVTMNRSLRTAVGRENIRLDGNGIPLPGGNRRFDVIVVYQTRAGGGTRWHVRAYEVRSEGQTFRELNVRFSEGQTSLVDSIHWDDVTDGIREILP
jgi:hypothetical protein